ncbi:uncharacterized protein [Parasteatoda tepidariorum]|uniref:uncharacterized protein n=1 Tax=Parasteatoda tepidariorum TaxID=114398 RepID=UPI00077FBA9A|nr:uncharacterized protein LOC107442874 [Parasteatoda tepidariorum]
MGKRGCFPLLFVASLLQNSAQNYSTEAINFEELNVGPTYAIAHTQNENHVVESNSSNDESRTVSYDLFKENNKNGTIENNYNDDKSKDTSPFEFERGKVIEERATIWSDSQEEIHEFQIENNETKTKQNKNFAVESDSLKNESRIESSNLFKGNIKSETIEKNYYDDGLKEFLPFEVKSGDKLLSDIRNKKENYHQNIGKTFVIRPHLRTRNITKIDEKESYERIWSNSLTNEDFNHRISRKTPLDLDFEYGADEDDSYMYTHSLQEELISPKKCHLPKKMKHSELRCIISLRSIKCKQVCAYGAYLKDGKSKAKITCRKNKGWWGVASHIRDCDSHLKFKLKLYGGEGKCMEGFMDHGPRCHIDCGRGKETEWHECDTNGNWDPPLPHCAKSFGSKTLSRGHYYGDRRGKAYVIKELEGKN